MRSEPSSMIKMRLVIEGDIDVTVIGGDVLALDGKYGHTVIL